VRVWPADDYTRVTLENDTDLKATHFIVKDPERMVVDIEGLELNPTLKSWSPRSSRTTRTSSRCAWARTGPTWCGWCST
jgi:hypothetical protein